MKPPVKDLVFESMVERGVELDRSILRQIGLQVKLQTLAEILIQRGVSALVREEIREALNAS